MRRTHHPQHDLLAHHLNRAGKIHLSLGEIGLGNAGRASEEAIECLARHRETAEVVEIFLIQRERPVVLEVDQFTIDEMHVCGLAVGRQTHDLVLTGVHFEPGVVGKRRVEEAERIRPVQLASDLKIAATPYAKARGRPLADLINRQDRCLLEGGWKERAGRMGLVVLCVVELTRISEFVPELPICEELLLDPERPRLQERGNPLGAMARYVSRMRSNLSRGLS